MQVKFTHVYGSPLYLCQPLYLQLDIANPENLPLSNPFRRSEMAFTGSRSAGTRRVWCRSKKPTAATSRKWQQYEQFPQMHATTLVTSNSVMFRDVNWNHYRTAVCFKIAPPHEWGAKVTWQGGILQPQAWAQCKCGVPKKYWNQNWARH